MQCCMYMHNTVNKWSKELKQYLPHSSLKFHPVLELTGHGTSWYVDPHCDLDLGLVALNYC